MTEKLISVPHTPLPWVHEREFNVTGPNRRGIATTGGHSDTSQDSERIHSENMANAAFIAHACNCHDELVMALEAMILRFYYDNGSLPELIEARAALNKAKKTQPTEVNNKNG